MPRSKDGSVDVVFAMNRIRKHWNDYLLRSGLESPKAGMDKILWTPKEEEIFFKDGIAKKNKQSTPKKKN